jgi:hypothetical protein
MPRVPRSRRPSARRVTAWLHPSLTCRLFRAPSPSFRPGSFRSWACCQGFVPSSRPHRRASTRGEDPSLARFRPQAFAASRRFSPLAGSGACFIPEPRPGHRHRSGASLPAQEDRLIAGPGPRTVGEAALTGRHSPAATRTSPRFRGVAPRGAAFTSAWFCTTTPAAPLLGFVSSGSTTARVGLASASTSARAVQRLGLRLRDGRVASTPAYPRAAGRLCLQRRRPARALWPAVRFR